MSATVANTPLIALTHLALRQFVEVYDELRDEGKVGDKTNGDVLFDLMCDKILGMRVHVDINRDDDKTPPKITPADLNSDDQQAAEPIDLPKPEKQDKPVEKSTGKPMLPKDIKINKLQYKGVNLDLPYLPGQIDYTKCCQCVKVCGGLLSPCLTHVKEGVDFCKPCAKLQEADKAYGVLSDREAIAVGDYTHGKKKEISYATYLAKKGFTVEEVNEFLQETYEGRIVIPDTPAYREIDTKKAKVAKKKADEVDENGVKQKRKPGRPKAKKDDEPKPEENEPVSEPESEQDDNASVSSEEEVQEAEEPVVETQENGELSEDAVYHELGYTYITFEGTEYIRDTDDVIFKMDKDREPDSIAGVYQDGKIVFNPED
jgi:hypothetical protein